MKRSLIAIVTFVVLCAGLYIAVQHLGGQEEAGERDISLTQFSDSSIQLAFDYPTGPDGYTVEDVTNLNTTEPTVVKAYSIINTKEKAELESSDTAREAPPTIQLVVYRNEQNQSANMWVDANPQLSNTGLLMGEIDRDAVVGGANAVRYTIDGLYMADNVVVANGGYIYYFSGSYLEADSYIRQDFTALIDSVRFTPPANTGEVTIQAACENALTYMLFESGEQADQFMAECLAGEHPEVVERYRDSMGGPTTPNIEVTSPSARQSVGNPITLTGEAQGNWFFEATAPVVVVNWDGLIIGEGYIEAEGDWMTTDMVPFSGSISYDLPADSYSNNGTVIFQRANASGLPENDAAVEIPVVLQQ